MKTVVNGVKFTPSEMEIIWQALDLKGSNAQTVELLYQRIAKKPDNPDLRSDPSIARMDPKTARDIVKKARKDKERAASAQQKWHKVCLGQTDNDFEG